MTLLLKRQWTRQPQGPTGVDWGNPLARGLVRLIDFSGPAPRDLVTGQYLTQVGSNVSSVVTRRGKATANTAESTFWTLPTNGETLGNLSMGWIGAFSGGSVPIIVRDNTSVGGNYFFRNNGGAWQHRYGGTDSSTASTINTSQVYVALFIGDSTTASTYVDGALIVQSAIGSEAFVSPWYIHQNGSNGTGPLATSVLMPIWRRPLSAAEGASWMQNPWQLFAPQQIIIPLEVAASGTPVLSAATVTSITSTAATPRVTVTF